MNKIILLVFLLPLLIGGEEPADFSFSGISEQLIGLRNYSISYITTVNSGDDINTLYYRIFENADKGMRRIEVNTIEMRNIFISRNDSLILINPMVKEYAYQTDNSANIIDMFNTDIFESLRILDYLHENKEHTEMIDRDGKKQIRYILDDNGTTISDIVILINSIGEIEMMEAYNNEQKLVLQTVFYGYVEKLPRNIVTKTEYNETIVTEEIRIIDILPMDSMPDTLFYPQLSEYKNLM